MIGVKHGDIVDEGRLARFQQSCVSYRMFTVHVKITVNRKRNAACCSPPFRPAHLSRDGPKRIVDYAFTPRESTRRVAAWPASEREPEPAAVDPPLASGRSDWIGTCGSTFLSKTTTTYETYCPAPRPAVLRSYSPSPNHRSNCTDLRCRLTRQQRNLVRQRSTDMARRPCDTVRNLFRVSGLDDRECLRMSVF